MATNKSAGFSSSKKKVQEFPNAPDLVGSIIEKGFSVSSSSTTRPPLPTVLPFPVARHRSHGGPNLGTSVKEELRPDKEEAEEENDADYESVSAFANPIKRKEKKDLDFSRWKEFVMGDEKKPQKPQSKKVITKTATKKPVAAPPVENKEPETKTTVKNERDSRNLAAISSSSTNGVVLSERELEMMVTSGQEPATLMDEIEAENLARLSHMSTDEITEAQAEIVEKMDPALLEMLKKRGLAKSGKKKGTGGQVEGNNKRPKMGASGGEWMPPGESSNKLWKIWRECLGVEVRIG